MLAPGCFFSVKFRVKIYCYVINTSKANDLKTDYPFLHQIKFPQELAPPGRKRLE